MFRSLLVVLVLFTELIFRDVFIVASLDHETCSAGNQECNTEEKKYPQLVMLDGVKVGHVQEIKLKEGRMHQLITKSLRPLLFEIPDFLSAEECEHIIKLAGKEGLFESTTMPDPEENTVLSEEEQNENCQQLLASDENRDGKISSLELAAFIQKVFNISINDTDVDLMLQQIKFDKDSDGFISQTECLEADHLAINRHIRDLEDRNPRQRTRLSEQAWLTVTGSTDPVLRDLQERIVLLTKLPRIFIEHSEELQVVKYGVHGHYHAHYDSTDEWDDPVSQCCGGDRNCSLCRFMTVLYYLNDVPRGGETAFPVADEEHFNKTDYEEKDRSNLSSHCYDANVVVRPKKGTAVMWYNHMISNVTGLLGLHDVRSLHGGCDVLEGSKWIANNWINAPFEWTDEY